MKGKTIALMGLCGVLALPGVAPGGVFAVRGIGGAGGMFTPAISPQDPNLMFISCDMSGSYRSLDCGKHWEMINCRQMNNSLKCRPLFVGDAVIWVQSGTPKISRDKGATWTPVAEGRAPWSGAVTRTAALPSDPSALMFGTDAELWRSTDGGKNWLQADSGHVQSILGLGGNFYVALDNRLLVSSDKGANWKEILAPEANGERFMSLAGGTDGKSTVIYGTLEKGSLLQSLDEGKTWKKAGDFGDIGDVRMTANQTQVAYVVQQCLFVLRTADGGKTWESAFRMNPINKQPANVEKSWVQTLGWGYVIMDLGLEASPTDPNVALVSTQGDFYMTRDGGKTWQQMMNEIVGVQPGDPAVRYRCTGLEVTSCWGYFFDPHDTNREYIAYTDIGFGRSVDNGQTWSWSAKGCPWANTFYDIVFDPDVKGRIYAATSGRHDIPHWTNIGPNDPKVPYHSGGVCVSDDGAVTWRALGRDPKGRIATDVCIDVELGSPCLGHNLPLKPCTDVCLDPTSPKDSRTLYTTMFGEGVFKSTNSGKTWIKKSAGLGNEGNKHVYRIRRHPVSGNLYCLITACRREASSFRVAGGIWKSTDGGDSWQDITAKPALVWVTAMYLDPKDENIIYMTAATAPGKEQGGVYKTIDGGKTWSKVLDDGRIARSGGSSYDHFMSVAVHPDDANLVYAGTTGHGFWFSRDGGKIWNRYDAFPFGNVQSINFHPVDHKKLYLTTFGGGVWVGPYLPE